MKKIDNFQLNLIDIKYHKDIVDLKMHNKIYKCQLTHNNIILITNSKGQCISSDKAASSENLNYKQKVFAKKILTFAQIALGSSV